MSVHRDVCVKRADTNRRRSAKLTSYQSRLLALLPCEVGKRESLCLEHKEARECNSHQKKTKMQLLGKQEFKA